MRYFVEIVLGVRKGDKDGNRSVDMLALLLTIDAYKHLVRLRRTTFTLRFGLDICISLQTRQHLRLVVIEETCRLYSVHTSLDIRRPYDCHLPICQ